MPWNNVSGGQFLWSEYKVGADFMKCDGVTMLVWMGKHSVHGTVRVDKDASKTEPAGGPYTLLGTSVQIADYLVKKVALYIERKSSGDTAHVVADMQHQLNKMK